MPKAAQSRDRYGAPVEGFRTAYFSGICSKSTAPRGDLVLASTTCGSMQRQELSLRGAQGKSTKLAELQIPAKYRYVPESTLANSPYNVAQLYVQLANSIRNGSPASPGFDAAVKRHRLIDAIVRASTTGQKQLFD